MAVPQKVLIEAGKYKLFLQIEFISSYIKGLRSSQPIDPERDYTVEGEQVAKSSPVRNNNNSLSQGAISTEPLSSS